MLEEGTFSDFYHKARKKVLKKKEEKKKKHQYPAGASGGDAGADAKQKLKDKQHKKYVNFLPSNVDEEANQEERLMSSLVKKYGTKKVEKAHKEVERRRKNKLSDKPITAQDLHDIIVYNNKRLGQEESEDVNEEAPPTEKHERMVKHIKKSYKKDGKLTDQEKSIAYATAWKNYNKEKTT